MTRLGTFRFSFAERQRMKTQRQQAFPSRPASSLRVIVLFLVLALLTASQAAETPARVHAAVDFGQALHVWDGFGVNSLALTKTEPARLR